MADKIWKSHQVNIKSERMIFSDLVAILEYIDFNKTRSFWPTVLLQALDEDERAEWVTELEKCRDFSDSGNGIEVEDLEMEDIGDYVRVHHMFSRILDFLFAITGSSRLMRISLLRISLLRFFKTITKIWLMRFYGLFILLMRTQNKNFANAILG